MANVKSCFSAKMAIIVEKEEVGYIFRSELCEFAPLVIIVCEIKKESR